MKELSVNHLLGIKYINKNDIDLIFETADHFKEVINRPIKKVQQVVVLPLTIIQLMALLLLRVMCLPYQVQGGHTLSE